MILNYLSFNFHNRQTCEHIGTTTKVKKSFNTKCHIHNVKEKMKWSLRWILLLICILHLLLGSLTKCWKKNSELSKLLRVLNPIKVLASIKCQWFPQQRCPCSHLKFSQAYCNTGTFPVNWKSARVQPVPGNYRLISIVSISSEIMEQLINSSVLYYVEWPI